MPVEELLHPRNRDIGGGFTVRRVLPSHPRQAVRPFVFFDHFGPVTTRPGDNHDVRPHPHIGLVVIGGEPLDGPRFIWWNFVSSSKARIEQAKEDGAQQRMGTIPGEHEWIPLP